MSTLTVLGLIFIGVGLGFILTKGFQLSKSIREDSKKAKKERENQK